MKLLKKLKLVFFILLSSILPDICHAQNSQDSSLTTDLHSIISISQKTLHKIGNKYSILNKMILSKTEKMLRKMQKEELAVQAKLEKVDSLNAQLLFAGNKINYETFIKQLKSPIDKNINNPLTEYIPGIDSLQTALLFIGHYNVNLPLDKLESVQALSKQIKEVQGSLQNANNFQQFIKERELRLKSQLLNSGMAKNINSINKQAFYYQQQLVEFKSILNDKKKMEKKLLETVNNLPAFKDFMKKHSYLEQLFGLPEDYGSAKSLIGLQTKSQVQQLLAERFGSIASSTTKKSGPGQFVNQQLQGGQQQIQQLQNQVNYLGIGGGSNNDLIMPDFKPNLQKTKPFLKRLEFNSTFSTTPSNSLRPSITDLGLTIGYKVDDKKVIGIKGNYKLGLGKGLDHIALSNEGVGFGGFADLKAKRGIWITGGFEYNYFTAFKNVQSLYNVYLWQKSALLGITKKYKIAGSKGGKFQLLYDFLYSQQRPQAQPFVFRMGYSL